MNKSRYFEGIGRRKEAVARVRIRPASRFSFTVNDKPFDDYFKTETGRWQIKRVLNETKTEKTIAINVKVSGGGPSGQAGAVSHGLTRALLVWKPELKTILRQGKFLTRDARVKERRKFGLKKARKAPQWSKR